MLGNQRFLDDIKGKKLILTIHTEREAEISGLSDRFKRVDTFIACTIKNEQALLQRFPDSKVVYIPHAVDENFYQLGDYNEEGKTVGYIGRIVPWKHYKEIGDYTKEGGK